jgi:uncharacterized membrane protein
LAAQKGNNHSPVPRQQPPPPPELIDKFLSLQEQELQIRTNELAIAAQQEENSKTIAEASIAANLQDRASERSHREKRAIHNFIGATVLVVVVLGFIGCALFLGKEAFVVKAMEIIGTFIAGFIGGYGFKAAKNTKDDPIQEN